MVDYLEPGFEPNFLTVSQLKQILLAHAIDFNPNQPKSELVDLFHRHIALRAASLRAASPRTLTEAGLARPRLNLGSRQNRGGFSKQNIFQTKEVAEGQSHLSPNEVVSQPKKKASTSMRENLFRLERESTVHAGSLPDSNSKLSPKYSGIESGKERIGPIVLPQIPALENSKGSLPRQRHFRLWLIPTSLFGQLVFALMAIFLVWYRVQIIRTSYCRPNEVAEKSTWFDLLRPSCFTCPANAICEDGVLKGCRQGYLIKQNPFSTKLLPLAPTCALDTSRLKRVEYITALAVDMLQRQLGRHMCFDGKVPKGFTVLELYQRLFNLVEPKTGRVEFGGIFDEIVKDLVTRRDVVEFTVKNTDGNEEAIVYAIRPAFSLLCKVKMSMASYARLYYREFSMALASVLVFEVLRRRIRTYYRETLLVRRCVAKVLDMLVERDHLHITQPQRYPENSISIMHARDQLLAQAYPDLGARDRVWSRVISHISTNTNVRTFQRDHRGDVHRVWEWVGDVPPSLNSPRRVASFGSDSPINSADEDGNDTS